MGIIIIRKKGIGRCLSYLLEKIEFIANEDLYLAAIFGFSPRSYETYEYFNFDHISHVPLYSNCASSNNTALEAKISADI